MAGRTWCSMKPKQTSSWDRPRSSEPECGVGSHELINAFTPICTTTTPRKRIHRANVHNVATLDGASLKRQNAEDIFEQVAPSNHVACGATQPDSP
eukprot:289922-Pyramimonas_sp.AAC.1